MLKFKLLTIEEGHVLKRYKPGSRGMANPIKRRLSHIKIILVEDKKAPPKTADQHKAEKVETKKQEVKTKVKSEEKTVKKVSAKGGSSNGRKK